MLMVDMIPSLQSRLHDCFPIAINKVQPPPPRTAEFTRFLIPCFPPQEGEGEDEDNEEECIDDKVEGDPFPSLSKFEEDPR